MSRSSTVLIVDDEKNTRDGLRDYLEEAFDVFTAPSVEGALEVLREERIDVLVTDLRLGARDGMELMELALKAQRPPVVIMLTAYGSVDTAVEAMKKGAYDFVTKPVNLERLELLIKRSLRERATQKENETLRRQVENPKGLEAMLGHSAVMTRVFDTIRQVAPSRATILLEGESGTGKELAARAVHARSNRATEPFVAVHCAALSPQLLESELFGHEKGAFTGAFERRIGRFEQANRGTLFLDEIGEIDSATQVKILRVLGERTFERVGGTQTIKTDVRLVAATNKNLEQLVAEGKFRDDLFFRLNVVKIILPPLRDRREDIPILAAAFLKESSEENEKPVREFSPEAMRRLVEYAWPGNVRELRAAVEHGVVMCSSGKIGIHDLPEALRLESSPTLPTPATVSTPQTSSPSPAPPSSVPSDPLDLENNQKQLILQALEATRGNRAAAARKLGISRRTLYRKLAELTSNPN